MIFYTTHIKDSIGNNYLGINIYPEIVTPYLENVKKILGEKYDEYAKLQKDRDHGKYHITVVNAIEYNRLSKEMGMDKFTKSLENIFEYSIDDIKLMGVGTAERNGNRAYFVVVNSEKLKSIRDRYNLPEQDFHITLAFCHKDVFGVRKNQVLKLHDPFLKLLKKEYYKNNESFKFVNKIENFDGNKDEEVEVIKIEDSYATFRIGKCQYYSIGLISDKLWITAKWIDEKNIPILPNTLIYRKIK